jgi:hypothetical protein
VVSLSLLLPFSLLPLRRSSVLPPLLTKWSKKVNSYIS